MKLLAKVALGAVAAFAAIQVATFRRTNPAVTADIRVSPEVKAVLRRSCYDCHSNETVWPWYSRVAPVSWLAHRDVTAGRAALNFSDWESLPPEKRSKAKRESAEEVADGEMPPWYYTPLHPHAALSRADKQLLEIWARGAAGSRGEKDGAEGD